MHLFWPASTETDVGISGIGFWTPLTIIPSRLTTALNALVLLKQNVKWYDLMFWPSPGCLHATPVGVMMIGTEWLAHAGAAVATATAGTDHAMPRVTVRRET